MHPKKYMDVILCSQKNTRLEISEILHADYSNHAFGSCGNFGLNCVRTISLAEIRTQKNTRRFFRPKKKNRVKSSTQKNTGVENVRSEKKNVGPPRHVYTGVYILGNMEKKMSYIATYFTFLNYCCLIISEKCMV